jgi:hypothetical protein
MARSEHSHFINRRLAQSGSYYIASQSLETPPLCTLFGGVFLLGWPWGGPNRCGLASRLIQSD